MVRFVFVLFPFLQLSITSTFAAAFVPRQKPTIPDLPKALVHRNAFSYEDLLDGLVTDEDMIKQYGSLISDYHRGAETLSVEELAYS